MSYADISFIDRRMVDAEIRGGFMPKPDNWVDTDPRVIDRGVRPPQRRDLSFLAHDPEIMLPMTMVKMIEDYLPQPEPAPTFGQDHNQIVVQICQACWDNLNRAEREALRFFGGFDTEGARQAYLFRLLCLQLDLTRRTAMMLEVENEVLGPVSRRWAGYTRLGRTSITKPWIKVKNPRRWWAYNNFACRQFTLTLQKFCPKLRDLPAIVREIIHRNQEISRPLFDSKFGDILHHVTFHMPRELRDPTRKKASKWPAFLRFDWLLKDEVTEAKEERERQFQEEVRVEHERLRVLDEICTLEPPFNANEMQTAIINLGNRIRQEEIETMRREQREALREEVRPPQMEDPRPQKKVNK